ncbi:centrosomal protein of 192 kDa [Lepeophtheirus salmonis]|uniref:centrosomal protein of 192 kDa n=1 Tax=Lepeophtheirus salmonis TaxID=72036 RepID=UPI001AE2CA72|nr:uncharacterized protein LOC121120421 [Lepeophtheirus salmonis]
MDPRADRSESSTSARSSLGLLRPDAISELSGISGYDSSGFVALTTEEEEDAEGDLEEEEEVFDDFEPTPVAYSSSQTFSSKSIEATTPVGLPTKLLVPSESTPSTPMNSCGLPPPVHRLLQNIVSAVNSGDISADNSRLSWDKIFGNQIEKESPSFCTGQFSARSTSFGTTNSSSSSKDECTQNERFSDYTNPPSALMSMPNSIQSNYSAAKDSPFGGAMNESGCFFDNAKFEEQKEKQEEFEKEEFRSLDSNFIDDAEKENKDKFRFIQEQTMSSDVTGSKLGFSQCLNNTNASAMLTEDQLSRSQYFMMNTSRLGNSICNATDDSSRPNLGFETIKSPKLKARPLLEKTVLQQSSTSHTNSTYTISDVSSASSVETGKDKNKYKKNLSMSDTNNSISINDSKGLEQVLKNKLSSDGQLDLNFISMLMNNSTDSSSSSDDKKGSAEYLVSMILKTLEASETNKKSSSFDMSCVSGALPSFLEMSSTSVSNDSSPNVSSRTLPSKSRKKSSGTRHSSPIRSQSLSRNEQKLKIQPINSVIKSSKSVDNDPNVSIVVMEQLKKNQCQLQVLTREGDRIDFGILPEDCSTTEDLVLVHNGQHDQEIRLEIQGQLPSFIYPTDGQTRYIKIISSKNIILTLPAISLSTTEESVACSIKISIHTPASGSDELKTLHSQINIICEGKLLAQVPMVARVGQAKLQTLKSNKIPILYCSPNGTWFEHSIPMMNFGNIQMTISLSIANSSLGIFKMEQNVMILQPKKEYQTHFKFYPQDVGEEECILRCTVQPNGTTYEVPIKICSKFTKDEDKENALKFPVVQLGKLPNTSSSSSSPLRKSSLGELNTKKVTNNNTPAKEGFVFPVEADKSFINWISVPVGTSEEQMLTLKNALPDAIAVTLVVRESNLFKVKINESDEYKRSVDIASLPGYGTICIKVSFQPTTLLKKNGDKIDVGKLIIKPRLGAGGKIYKATIALQGHAGAPEFTFSGFGDEVNGKQSLFLGQLSDKPIIKTLSIRNKGSGPGFCTCLALGNNGAKSDAISFENEDSIVLYPNESCIFRFTVDPRRVPMGDKNQVFVGFIHVFYGSELARSAMRKAIHKLSPSLKLTYESSIFGNGVAANMDTDYKGECESFSGLTNHLDVKSFYKNAKKMVVELSGITCSKEESIIKFNALPVEETLSESRMDNTNYNSTLFATQPHSPPTRCSPILEHPASASKTGKVFEIHDEEIFIESRKTVLVTLINVTRDTQGFDLGWPAHILMVQPSSGIVAPSQRETIAITAIAQERRKGSISVYSSPHNQESCQSIIFHVLPLKFTIEPDKIKFAHPGTEMNVTLKNHTEQRLQWDVKDTDPNFIISLKKGYLLSKGSIDFSILFRPIKGGVHFEKALCFTGKTEGSVGEIMTAILEVSGGQQPSHIPVPLQSIVSSNYRPECEFQQEPSTKKTVYLDKESISFPVTRVGEHSVVKVIVKNRLNAAQTFNVEALSTPFTTKYHETSIVIKPMSYLGFPVTFAPVTKGEFKQNIVLKNNHKILVGILMGSCE